jgi:hypothetical protein
MKRDMDLIRELLLRIESTNNLPKDLDLSFPAHHDSTVAYHLRLLVEARLITYIDTSTMQGESYLVTGLTWDGHDFLEASRDETRWRNAKEMIAKKGGGMVFDVVKQVLVKLLSDQVL